MTSTAQLQSLLADPGAAGNWTLAPEGSSVTFTNKTLWGLVPVNGRFTDISGHGRVGTDGTVSGRLDIAVASVRTGIGKRDEHLRSADFFDAEHHPEITVEVTGITPGGELQATMTIRGVTLPVPLTVTAARDGADGVQVSARTQVDRTRWGVSGNMIGMMPTATTLSADVLFRKSTG